jgi:outer membrane receptor for ferrienterochelin and colicin
LILLRIENSCCSFYNRIRNSRKVRFSGISEILANTPSVYVTKQGGGFGDARINIRGFDQRNIAVMINGVPVNDMENGAVYWSNWAGLSDVTLQCKYKEV